MQQQNNANAREMLGRDSLVYSHANTYNTPADMGCDLVVTCAWLDLEGGRGDRGTSPRHPDLSGGVCGDCSGEATEGT